MASTTLLQFNPGQTNQETDATYLADSNRSGGFGADAIWPSVLANKTLNQLSNYLFALFTAFAQKGYTTNDDDIALLTATCANFITDADILPGVVSVAFSPTAVFNAGSSNGFQMSLTGNVTSSTITGQTPGQLIALYFTQDATGGRTVAYPASFVGAIQPDPTANAVSLQMFRIDLAGIPRAVTPVISGTASGLEIFNAFTLSSGSPVGSQLVGNGTSFAGRVRAKRITNNVFGTTYTNTTGASILASVTAITAGGSGGTIQISTGGVPLFQRSGQAVGGLAQVFGAEFEVLAGEPYRVDLISGSAFIDGWIEWYYA